MPGGGKYKCSETKLLCFDIVKMNPLLNMKSMRRTLFLEMYGERWNNYCLLYGFICSLMFNRDFGGGCWVFFTSTFTANTDELLETLMISVVRNGKHLLAKNCVWLCLRIVNCLTPMAVKCQNYLHVIYNIYMVWNITRYRSYYGKFLISLGETWCK